MEYRDLIRFVPAGVKDVDTKEEANTTSNVALTGDEARTFYETIVNDPNTSSRAESEHDITYCDETTKQAIKSENVEYISVKQEESDSVVNTEESEMCINVHRMNDTGKRHVHQRLLKHAQHGELQELKRLVRTTDAVDVNFQDSYGWTALMVSAVGGHLDVLEYLLSVGANKYILNNKGKNVLELCEEVGAVKAKTTINCFNEGKYIKTGVKETQTFFCDVCSLEFQEMGETEHLSSTVHLFNLKLKPNCDRYLIPETNKGFQIMMKSGWDGEKGLGPQGQGHKYPIRTKLKQDRLCLGTGDSEKAKVTHFGAYDPRAIKSAQKSSNFERIVSVKTISKREKRNREKRDKIWERNLRLYMNTDT